MKFVEDGTQWYNYFTIRQDNDGHYYFAWTGTTHNVYPDNCWRSVDNMKSWIVAQNWRQKVDEEFEREVLSGPQER